MNIVNRLKLPISRANSAHKNNDPVLWSKESITLLRLINSGVQQEASYVFITAQCVSLGLTDLRFALHSIDRERPLLSLRADERSRAGCNGFGCRMPYARSWGSSIRELSAKDTATKEPSHGKRSIHCVHTHALMRKSAWYSLLCKAAVVQTMNLQCSRVTFTFAEMD